MHSPATSSSRRTRRASPRSSAISGWSPTGDRSGCCASTSASCGRRRSSSRSKARMVGVDEAERLGLVLEKVDSGRLLARARELAAAFAEAPTLALGRSEEHTSELQSPMRSAYGVFCLKKKKQA